MSDIIQLLPDHVANQIAAGEVVQRPASVVKELMENAIDAEATLIQVIIRDAGKSKIQITDNGKGMSPTDLRMAFERHATSKIRSTEDIFNIRTKGFRGEALASIAAIAQVETKTHHLDYEMGNLLAIEGGEVRSQEACVCAHGTSITVKNLFYNVPARRNFLKSNHVEFRHIIDEFQRVALAHPDKSFELFHNDTEVFMLRQGNLKKRIIQVFGRKMESNLIPIHEETDVVKFSGFITKPEVAKKNKNEQFFFVNHRFVKNAYMHKAVADAYKEILPTGYQPSYFVFFALDPKKIDINIHPGKTEVKFEDDHLIFSFLRSTIKHSLGQFNVTESLDFSQDSHWTPPLLNNQQTISAPKISVNPHFNPFETPSNPTSVEIAAQKEFYEADKIAQISFEHDLFQDNEPTIYCFQFKKSYLIATVEDEIWVIDQYQLHQSLLFQKFERSLKQNTMSQRLMFPVSMEFSTQEIEKIRQIEEVLTKLGFDLLIAGNAVEVHAQPTQIQTEKIDTLFSDFLAALDFTNSVEMENEIPKMLAASAAIPKGQALEQEEVSHLVQELKKQSQMEFSPSGKRIYQKLNVSDLEKLLHV